MERKKIRLKNLPKEGRTIMTKGKPKVYKNGDTVEMVEAQAKAYVNADVGEEVKSEPTKKTEKP